MSGLDAKLNPRFAELLMIAFREPLETLEVVFRRSLTAALQDESPEIVDGWLRGIPKLLEASPLYAADRKLRVEEMCAALRMAIA